MIMVYVPSFLCQLKQIQIQAISQKIENIFSVNHLLLKETLVEAAQENIL